MKNTVSKGFLYYLFLLASIVLGVACIFMAILIFSPGKELFGIKFVYEHGESHYLRAGLDNDDESNPYIQNLILENKINTINIETNYVDFDVKYVNITHAQFQVAGKIVGFAYQDYDTYVINISFNEEEKSLDVKVIAPRCKLMLAEQAELVFALPSELNTSQLDLNITTDTGLISFGNSKNHFYTFKNLNIVSTNNSSIRIGHYNPISEELNIKSVKGNILLDTTRKDLKNTSSIIDNEKISIETDSAKIEVGNVKTKNFNIISNSSSIKIGTIDGNLKYDADKGVIIVDKITGQFTCTEMVRVSNVQIGKVYDSVILPSAQSSNITIDELYANCDITTESGNVKIKKMFSRAWIKTKGGNIDIEFTPDDNLIKDFSDCGHLETESGNITANFNNVKKCNEISTTSGKIVCNFNNNATFKLIYTCSKNAPTLSDGINSGNVKMHDEIIIGSNPGTNSITITNTNGHTEISDELANA